MPDEDILAAIDTERIAASISAPSQWIENDAFSVSSSSIDAVNDFNEGDTKRKTAQATVAYSNSFFKVTCKYSCDYVLDDKNWILLGCEEYNRVIEPISGIDDAKIIEQIPTLLELVDSNPPKNPKGDKQYLRNLYKENVAFAIESNDTTSSGGSVKVSIKAKQGFASYSGTLTTSFVWNGTEWEVSSCSVDDAAYMPDFSSLVGTWSGTRHDGNAAVGQECLAGESTPCVISVKSTSDASQVMTADAEFVSHKHKWLDNVSATAEGDTVEKLTDALFKIPMPDDKYVRVYEYEGNEGPSYYSYTIDISTDSTGESLEVRAVSVWEYETHYDFYTLAREEQA